MKPPKSCMFQIHSVKSLGENPACGQHPGLSSPHTPRYAEVHASSLGKEHGKEQAASRAAIPASHGLQMMWCCVMLQVQTTFNPGAAYQVCR